MIRIPIVHGMRIGDEELYGMLDENGYFFEVEDPLSAPLCQVSLLSSRLGLEHPCEAQLLDLSGEPVATLDIGVRGNRVACLAITALPGKELTGQLLRQAPIASLIREAARGRVVTLRKDFAVRFTAGGKEMDELKKNARRTLDANFLERVATIYRDALASGRAPAISVQEQLGPTTPENARRWISQARQQGFLGEAPGPGRAGELFSRENSYQMYQST